MTQRDRITAELADHALLMALYERQGRQRDDASAQALSSLRAYRVGYQWAVDDMTAARALARTVAEGGA